MNGIEGLGHTHCAAPELTTCFFSCNQREKQPVFVGVCCLNGTPFFTQVDYIRLYPMRSERDGPSNKPLTAEERHTLGAMTLSQKERDRILAIRWPKKFFLSRVKKLES